MNDYETRASILLQQGIICQQTYDNSLLILAKLNQKYSFNETNFAFVMHLFMCLERAYNDTQLHEDLQLMHTELKNSNDYEACYKVFLHLQSLANVAFNESEKTFILMHLVNLHQQGKEEKIHGSD